MANISGFLQNILSARFGKDVRQSIHDAIEEIDKVADTAKDSATAMAKTATEKASEASGYASSAKTSEENAKSYMESAKTSENNSKTSETNAKTSETNAKASEINAKVSEENAQAVFESLPEDYNTLSKEFYEVAIKQKASGEDIHVNDSSNAKVREFAMFGKARQQTTSGKNKFDIDTRTFGGNAGGTFNYSNKVLTIQTVANVYSGVHCNVKDASFVGNSITLSMDVTISNGSVVLIGYSSSKKVAVEPNKKTRVSITTTPSSESNSVVIYSGEDVAKTIIVENIQIEYGTVATPYEKFTNGQPSPSPDYPQPIEVSGASGSVEVKSVGKNLLKNTMESQTINGVTFTVNDDGSVLVNGTATANISISLNYNAEIRLPSNSYILSTGYGTKSNNEGYPLLTSTTFYKDGTLLSDHVANSKGAITIDDNVDYISRFRVYIKSGVTVNNVTVYPMLIRAEDSDTYEPYKETLSTIPTENGLCGVKVTENGNYTDQNGQQWICDEIVKYADESGERVQRVQKKQITSDLSFQTWATKNGTYNRYMSAANDMKRDNNAHILCNVLSQITMTSAYREESILGIFPDGTSNNTNTYIGFINPEWTTIDEFKAFLDANEVYVYYELAEPIRTPLTAEEIAEIEKLCTFNPITNISNDADCGMSVTYLADSKLYIDNRLAQIEQALIANI